MQFVILGNWLKLTTMKNILVPTDFSDCANEATMVALDIARKAKAEICFLHLHKVTPMGSHAAMHGGTSNCDHHSGEGHVKGELDKLVRLAENLGIRAKPVLVRDEGQEQIRKYVRPFNIDFIVMGSHGASGLKEAFMGSNAQRMIRDSSVPVLVVKNKIEKFQPGNIVFASNFEREIEGAFEQVKDFAVLWNAKLHLLYVNTSHNFKQTDQTRSNLNYFAGKLPGTSINIYDASREKIGIQEFAHEKRADLIAMTTHGGSGLMKILLPSIAESLVNHEEVPMLIINTSIQADE